MNTICLTPVKNEEWILETFLQCVSLWADHIIIADQQSSDRSCEIAKSFDKVTLLRNDSDSFNEPDRQKMLINEARKFKGPNLLIALDADEILSGNFIKSDDWQKINSLGLGSRIYLESINVDSTFTKYWTKGFHYFGFVDDGTSHKGFEIDSPRLPDTSYTSIFYSQEIKILHLQYIDAERAKFKQIWYQCLEKTLSDITYLGKKKTNYYIFQRYNKYKFEVRDLNPINEKWINLYENSGIKLKESASEKIPFLDYIKIFFDKYGTKFFEKLDIWDEDWNRIYQSQQYTDPRNAITQLIHRWLNNRKELRLSYFENWLLQILEFLKIY